LDGDDGKWDSPFVGEYIAFQWQLVGNQIMLHKPTITLFEIRAVGQVLVANAIEIPLEDIIRKDDFEIWESHAVIAYLDAVGFSELKVLKPN